MGNIDQGSARTPRYTVVVDDCDYKLDELQLLTHGLCFGFQVRISHYFVSM